MGLTDVRQVVHLMNLTAAGRVELPQDAHPPTSEGTTVTSGSSTSPASHFLQHLSNAIAALAQSDPAAAKMVVNICTKVR
jgi:hypothetical protein